MALPAPVNQQNIKVRIADGSFRNVCPFPVGFIYQSYNSTSPADIYGGSWTNITGRFLYCNNGTGTGGSNTHKLSANEMPSHSHTICLAASRHDGQSDYGLPLVPGYAGRVAIEFTDNAHTTKTNNTGGNAAHNNMPAYQTCYAWRRTA